MDAVREIVVPFSFILIVAIDAYTDSNRVVNHRRGLAVYALACVLLSAIYFFFFDVHWYWLVSFAIITRLAGFDPMYNLFAGKKFTYEGSLNKPDPSLFDQIENLIPISVFWKRIIYFVKYISFLIIYFLYA